MATAIIPASTRGGIKAIVVLGWLRPNLRASSLFAAGRAALGS